MNGNQNNLTNCSQNFSRTARSFAGTSVHDSLLKSRLKSPFADESNLRNSIHETGATSYAGRPADSDLGRTVKRDDSDFGR